MTKAQKLKAVYNVLTDYLVEVKANDEKLGIKGATADVRITIEENRVLMTYDGAGFDYFSFDSVIEHPFTGRTIYYGDDTQEKLNKLIQEIDPELYIENCNPWSFAVYG